MILNGKNDERLSPGINISQMIEIIKVNPANIAIEVDGKIIPKSSHKNFILTDKMQIEIIAFVGGG